MKKAILLMFLILVSISYADILDSDEKLAIVVEFEGIKINLADLGDKVENIINHYESTDKEKAEAWKKVADILETANEKVEDALDLLGESEVEASDIKDQAELISNELDNIFSEAYKASTGKAPTASLASLKEPKEKPDESDTSQSDEQDSGTSPKSDAIELEFYVMSQCPYGTQVEDAIAPVLEQLGDSINFHLDFIGREEASGFNSLHGEPEVLGDKVQLCAIKHEPDKYMDMIVCMNQNARGIPGNWESCATQNNLDVVKIRECYEGEEGNELLRESFKKSQQKQATGSPTIFINGQAYNRARDTLSFTRAICAELDDHPECADLPACATDADCQKTGKIGTCVNPGTDDAKCEYSDPISFEILVVNDKRCGAQCDISRFRAQLQQMFPGMKLREVDYATEEGKKLYDDNQLTLLPAMLFDEKVKETATYKSDERIQGYFQQQGDYLLLRIGASFDPRKEICDNGKDDTGDGLIDCESPDCKSLWECMEKVDEPVVELFVMSHCPYGTQIEKGIVPVIETIGDQVDFQLKFVNYAMHQKKEIDEQMNQYCIQKEYPDKLIEYLRCFLGTTAGSAEEGAKCIEEVGLDAAKISECVKAADEEFGVTAGYEDKSKWQGQFPPFPIHDEECQKYGVRGSPTLVINGAIPQTGRDAQSLLTTICSTFKEAPAECETDLSGEGSPTAGFGFKASPVTGAATTNAGCGT